MGKGYRIISIEACEIYAHEQEYGVAAGYKLPERKSNAYFWLFKNRLNDSLDTIESEKAYTRICRKKFAFQDSFGNNYTIAIVNLKFNYTYKPAEGKPVAIKQLRKYYYENGFYMDGVHYVRYKRSAGSSCQGECSMCERHRREHTTAAQRSHILYYNDYNKTSATRLSA